MFERVEGRNAIKFGSNIYPDPDDFEYEKILDRFGIKLEFLFDDGILVEYPVNLEPNETPGDVSFYSSVDRSRILTFTESFGCIEIYGPETRSFERSNEPICIIKIVDDYYNISEKPIIEEIIETEDEEGEEEDD